MTITDQERQELRIQTRDFLYDQAQRVNALKDAAYSAGKIPLWSLHCRQWRLLYARWKREASR